VSSFDTIPKDRLMAMVKARIADGRVLALLQGYLSQGVLEELTLHAPTAAGTPQGAVISPLLANIYLDPLDHLMVAEGLEMVRYADDFVILCRDQKEAETALARVQAWVEANGLTLHPEKTRIIDADQPGGFDFLGYHFERGKRWPRRKALLGLRERVRELTPRSNGVSLERTIQQLNRVLRGWYAYFRHSSNAAPFHAVDSFVRQRLRSILRRRRGRYGLAAGADHHRWPNLYFTERGLLSLVQARAAEVPVSA
jgi:RNA-directed DNA polymerase